MLGRKENKKIWLLYKVHVAEKENENEIVSSKVKSWPRLIPDNGQKAGLDSMATSGMQTQGYGRRRMGTDADVHAQTQTYGHGCKRHACHEWSEQLRLNPIICLRPSSYVHVCLRPCPYTCAFMHDVCIHAHTSAFEHVRLRPYPYVCVRALASAFVRVRASAFVCVHIIKSPDASARIISDASGRVFHSGTFEVYYIDHFI